MYISIKLQKLEKECSNHWIQQIKEASQKENFNEIEYSTYSLLRFFRSLDESDMQKISIDDFYQQIIHFIKETEEMNETNNTNFIHFFRSITHIIISDFYRGFNEINKITLDSAENEEESFSYKIEKSDIIYIKLSCLSFFNRYDDAIALIQQMISDGIDFQDDLMRLDFQIRQSFLLIKQKKYEEASHLLQDIRSQEILPHHPFLTPSDIDFQLGASFLSQNKDDSIKNGFDTLINLASVKPETSLFQISYAYAARGDYAKSLEFAIQIEPSSRPFEASLLIGFLHYRLGRLAESYEILRGLLKCSQFEASVSELIGLVLLKTGDTRSALQPLRNAFALDQTDTCYASNYGLALEVESESADEFYAAMMKRSSQWEVFANRSCAFNRDKICGSLSVRERIVEPRIEKVVQPPADEQIEKFFMAAPFLPAHFMSCIDVKCQTVPISPLQRRISLFPSE